MTGTCGTSKIQGVHFFKLENGSATLKNFGVIMVDDVLSKFECDELMRYSNEISGTSFKIENTRTRTRIIHKTLADFLWSRIGPYIMFGVAKSVIGFQPTGIHEVISLQKRNEGFSHVYHTDPFVFFNKSAVSLLSVLFYLNHNFQGGATRFSHHRMKDVGGYSIMPRAGAAVVFPHDTFHASSSMFKGDKQAVYAKIMFDTKDACVRVQ